MNTAGFVTIDEVVSDLQYRGQDYSLTNYDYWFHLCIQGIKKMNIFNLRTANIAYLEMNGSGILQLPQDYVDYIQIGVVDGQGVFRTLTWDPNIFPVPHETCGENDSVVLRADKAVAPAFFRYPGFNGWWIGQMYGLTGGYNVGYYNINRATNELYISGLAETVAIVLEYKTTGVSINGVTMVRTQMQEALISWCMMTAQKFNVIQSQTNWATVYYGDENELESLDQAITMEEFRDIIYGSKKQTPKG